MTVLTMFVLLILFMFVVAGVIAVVYLIVRARKRGTPPAPPQYSQYPHPPQQSAYPPQAPQQQYPPR